MTEIYNGDTLAQNGLRTYKEVQVVVPTIQPEVATPEVENDKSEAKLAAIQTVPFLDGITSIW